MLSTPFIVEHQLSVLTVSAPFQIEDILSYLGRVHAGWHRGVRFETPTLLDFRAVRLTQLTAVDAHRFLIGRKAISNHLTGGPIMMFCGEARSFGLLRMFGMLSEIHGMGHKDELPVSMDPYEVLGWVSQNARLNPMDRMRVRMALTQAPGTVAL